MKIAIFSKIYELKSLKRHGYLFVDLKNGASERISSKKSDLYLVIKSGFIN